MKGNEVNIRIAEHLGVLRTTWLDDERYYDGLDYENSVEAMIKATNTLTEAQRAKYVLELIKMHPGVGLMEWNFLFHNMPAKDRAAAFLEAIL